LKKYESIDFADALGSNIIVCTKTNSFSKTYVKNKIEYKIKDFIVRILPKTNENINEV